MAIIAIRIYFILFRLFIWTNTSTTVAYVPLNERAQNCMEPIYQSIPCCSYTAVALLSILFPGLLMTLVLHFQHCHCTTTTDTGTETPTVTVTPTEDSTSVTKTTDILSTTANLTVCVSRCFRKSRMSG